MNDLASPPSPPVSSEAAVPAPVHTVVQRLDYRAPAWLVPDIALDFALGLESTRVRSTLSVARNPEATPEAKVAFVLEAEVTLADGEVVARTRGDYQIRPYGK